MSSVQESTNSMFLAARGVLITHEAALRPLPKCSDLIDQFVRVVDDIAHYGGERYLNKKGFAEAKKQNRFILVDEVVDIAHRVKVYASLENNQVLLNETKFSKSELKRCSDTQLSGIATGIHSRAQANLAELQAYGVTEERLETVQNALTAFVTSIPQPRWVITTKRLGTNKLDSLYKEANAILKKIDMLIVMVKKDHPELYDTYKGVRRVVNTSPNSLVLKGIVVDAATSEPIKGAILEFVLNGSDTKLGREPEVIVKRTAEKGRFYIKSLQPGIYNITVKKTGYADIVETVAVAEGERTEVRFKLAKI